MTEFPLFGKITTAESPRDCPPGTIYMDETPEGFVRVQIIGGAQDGLTVYATEDECQSPST